MNNKSKTRMLKIQVVLLFLFTLWVADCVGVKNAAFFGPVIKEITDIFHGSEIQWLIFLCFGIYFISFVFLRFFARGFKTKPANVGWLMGVICIGMVQYAINYSPSISALLFLGTAMIGQVVAFGAEFEIQRLNVRILGEINTLIAFSLVFISMLAFVWNPQASHFVYQGRIRWSGPWDNPNLAGLLMGVALVLALGQSIHSMVKIQKQKEGNNHGKPNFRRFFLSGLCFSAILLMAWLLFCSYSRGAWLATFAGLCWLCHGRQKLETKPGISWIKTNLSSIGLIVFSVMIICFWHFQQLDWHPARRVFSIINQNDFSWRNRVAAWEGGMQMMAEKPWFGFGWDWPETMYRHYYLSPKLNESAAFEMNDYLLMGTTLGIPSLLCFGTYLWLSIALKREISVQNPSQTSLAWQQTTCRAGAVVLLIGFWFDGGLFKLTTAVLFWVLLELGNVRIAILNSHGGKIL